jgi:hypothetical protein
MTDDTSLYGRPSTTNTPPAPILAWLDGHNLQDKVGTAIGVYTADADGWPHPAHLSPGEVLLAPDGEVRLAVWAKSTTSENLRRDGRVVLMLAADGGLHELRFEVTETAPRGGLPLATFSGRMVVAREHRVPYAKVVSGVQFTLHDPDATLERWHGQVDALRSLGEAAQVA